MPRPLHPAIALLVLASVIGCESRDLDRGAATRLVEATEEFRSLGRELVAGPGTRQLGVALDVWGMDGFLTAEGRRVLVPTDGRALTPVTPVPIALEVTGIAPLPIGEDKSIVEVEVVFRSSLDVPLKALAASMGGGSVIARRFDDGWRLDQLDLRWRPGRYDYRAALGVQGDMGLLPAPMQPAELEVLRARLAAVREGRLARMRDLDALIAQSTVPSESEVAFAAPIQWSSYTAQSLELTDVSVMVRHAQFDWGGEPADQVYPFRYLGSIPSFQPYDNQLQIYWRCMGEDWARDIRLNICLTTPVFPSAEEAQRFRQRLEARYAVWQAKYGSVPKERAGLLAALQFVGS